MPTIEEFSDPEDEVLADVPSPPPVAARARGNQRHMKPVTASTSSSSAPIFSPLSSASFAVDSKKWKTIYPIYIDAKRPYKSGSRRVAKSSALNWPLSEMIWRASTSLGLRAVHEPEKRHPRDWENPGRCKVMFTSPDGSWLNASIQNKHTLLLALGHFLRPYDAVAPPATIDNPHPLPPIELRLPRNSPAVSHGVYADALSSGGGQMAKMMGGMMPGLMGNDGPAEEEAEKEIPKKKIDLGKKQKMIRVRGR